MNRMKHISLVAALIISIAANAQSCNIQSTDGTDFWVTFMPNSNTIPTFSFFATGNTPAAITVSNPKTSYTQTYTHTAGSITYMELPNGYQTMASAIVGNNGFHITSTQPIFLFVSNYWKDSWDVANVLPTSILGTHYIVQDNNIESHFPPTLAMVASEDNTQVTFAIPIVVDNMSESQIGVPTSFNLNKGNTLVLKGNNITTGFCGMEINSTKPIAVFQGHSNGRVGDPAGGRGHMMEQARPIDLWGNEFLVASTMNRTEGDVVVITSSDNNCNVQIDGTNVATLNRRESYTHTLPPNTTAHIVTSKPAYTCMYTWSYSSENSLGNPSSVSINPVSNWVCSAVFPVYNCNPDFYDEQCIAENHHYINIMATADAMDSLRIDGQLVHDASFISAGYKYARLNITPGPHSIMSPTGTFFAHVYGCGKQVQYNFDIGMATGFLPDTIILRANKDSVCPGEEVELTAVGSRTHLWSSDPYDAEIADMQGMNPISVHPTQTTVYNLMDNDGNVAASITVNVRPTATLCVEMNRNILDFDNPMLILSNCSDGHSSTRWEFDDGRLYTGENVHRRFEYPLPDSTVVTMTSCNQYNCCADTVISIPMKINSVWFPNIFMPGADDNNLFQCFTSMDVAVFELAIYDRWGILVWSSEDVNQPWDGRNSDGTPCPQGAYAYRYYLKATDNTLRHGIGTVTLIK